MTNKDFTKVLNGVSHALKNESTSAKSVVRIYYTYALERNWVNLTIATAKNMKKHYIDTVNGKKEPSTILHTCIGDIDAEYDD